MRSFYSNIRFRRNLRLAFSGCLRLCAVALVMLGGCQTLSPFRASVQQKAVMLRQWTHDGLDAMQNGRLAQARTFFTRACSQSPEDALALVNLARADRRLGDLPAAVEHMQAAMKLTPNEPELHVELGELYFYSGRRPQAIEQAKQALALDSHSAGAWALWGKTQHAQGNYTSALANYQRALSYQSRYQLQTGNLNEEVTMLMADLYQTLGKSTRALATVEQLLSRYPQDRQPEAALLAKGRALMRLQQWEPAIDVLMIACDRTDASVEAFIRLGEAQVSRGQFDGARATLIAARQQHPNVPVLEQLAGQLRATTTARPMTAIADGSNGVVGNGRVLR